MSLFRRLLSAARGRGGLEDKLVLLGVISGGLFVTLVATLFVVQQRLGSTQRRLADEALPAEKQIGRLEASIGAAFGRQAQVSSTVDLKQLEPLRDRSAVEAPLRQAARAIAERLGEPARALDPHVAAFLDADAALYAAVARRHELQAAFEKELGAVDGDVRALVQDSQAVSGMLRLEYVL